MKCTRVSIYHYFLLTVVNFDCVMNILYVGTCLPTYTAIHVNWFYNLWQRYLLYYLLDTLLLKSRAYQTQFKK